MDLLARVIRSDGYYPAQAVCLAMFTLSENVSNLQRNQDQQKKLNSHGNNPQSPLWIYLFDL